MSGEVNYRLETILVRNLSLEVPENIVMPEFKEKPEVQMEMRNKSRTLGGGEHYEVILEVTARIKSGANLQLLIEIEQVGVFYLEGADSEQRQLFLAVAAPTMLYPYLTQLMGDLMSRAGAPRVFLPPFDFSAVQQQRKQQMQADEGSRGDGDGENESKVLS